jgi:GAF domain-containing protein
VYATVSIHAPRLLPGTLGRLFIHDPEKDLFRSAAAWGEQPPVNPAFKAEDCWAMRRGRTHVVTSTSTNLPCSHGTGERSGASLCIPLAAIGKTIGLALSNLMLRSELRELSNRDPRSA